MAGAHVQIHGTLFRRSVWTFRRYFPGRLLCGIIGRVDTLKQFSAIHSYNRQLFIQNKLEIYLSIISY